jgi:hypothetical protein
MHANNYRNASIRVHGRSSRDVIHSRNASNSTNAINSSDISNIRDAGNTIDGIDSMVAGTPAI